MNNFDDSKASTNGHVEFHDTFVGVNGDADTEPALASEKPAKSINSNYCMWTLLVTTASTMMSVGLAVGALNPTLDIMMVFYNETYQVRHGSPIPEGTLDVLIALTVSMLLAGGFLGALSLGFFVKFFTRKGAMVTINFINVIAVMLVSIAGYLIPSYEAIIIGRFIMGFVSGIAMNLIPMVTSETSTKSRSAFYLSLIGVNLSFGGLVGLVLGYDQFLGNDDLWPILLAVPALPSVVYICFSPLLPETPSYLLLKRDKKEAFQTLKRLRVVGHDDLLHKELAAIQQEQKSQGSKNKSVPLLEMFRHVGYRKQLFLVVMVFMESQFCGINGIGMYTDIIFKDAGIKPDYVTFASMIVYFVQFLVALAGSKAVDKWGPRRLSIFWSLMMSLTLALLTVSMATFKFLPEMAYVSVAAVTLYVLSWACGPNITLFPLVAALTTEPTREASFKFGGGLFWIASWFVSFIPTYIKKGLGNYAYVPWAVCNLFFTIYFYLEIPETRGKTIDEIQLKVQGKTYQANEESSLEILQTLDSTDL